ncbi:phosphopantothenate/pantothenate synthetase [Methanobrevibacter sp. TMH8]|uniref:4-phosphopantoate--beta-alanine ligase n=1 Tax=Methanobrevibacter sp. TMH8 TaxID=2848611 RepID=UPI001CCD6881|nr:4-phosphopantoate--beta-alanine ligase [Methanobrevibacter sp. TMH8]MBZ9570890.1 phosphopantothenate/pantothenate synthetase [Methanobrevibacter sp. TMH8]
MIPKNHPRYESLVLREKIKNAYKEGYLADSGMIAHGRGETFDYLIGEKTNENSIEAIKASVATLLLAKNPVISVNGNSTALAIKEIIELANVTNSKIEINLFYRTKERVKIIAELYKKNGYDGILGTDDEKLKYIDNIDSPRATASEEGIYSGDVILVSLEDGDRAEVLVNSDKKIIAIDLNPLSRTAKIANISIIDNIVRAIPLMIEFTKKLKSKDENYLKNIINNFSNEKNLEKSFDNIDLHKLADN